MKCTVLGVLAFLAVAAPAQPLPAAEADPAGLQASATLSTPYPGGRWQPGPARYAATIVDDVPIAMDDGVVLRASIAFPTDLATGRRSAGRFPVVIEHTPYTRLSKPVVPNVYLTERGYIYATVRARGTGTSGGEVAFFSPREGRDGRAVVEWAANRLEGSDGRVALLGCSYPAGIAFATAAQVGARSPVKAVIAACNALNSVQRETWMVGGVTTPGINYAARAPALMGDSQASQRFFPQLAADIAAGGEAAYDRDYWRDRLPLSLAQKIADNDIPVLLWAGWRDIAVAGVMRTYAALQNAHARRPIDVPMGADQAVTPKYQLIMGEWEHARGLDAGIYLQWLETWVRGVDTGIQATPTPMHLFESGTNRWINLARYPVVAEYTSWYLGESGRLTASVPSDEGRDTLRWSEAGTPDGGLSFVTSPFAEGATLAGPVSATLYASSSNTNLLLLVRLFDVAPDGSAALVTKGLVLGSQRALDARRSWKDRRGTLIWPWPTLRRDEYLAAGKLYKLDVSLAPHQWGVRPGHRLRLDLMTQHAADVCPVVPATANGAELCRLSAPQRSSLPGGSYEILRSARSPSALHLPLLPAHAFPSITAGVLPSAWSESNRTLESRDLPLPLDWGGKGFPASMRPDQAP